jgi:hypothetical protein
MSRSFLFAGFVLAVFADWIRLLIADFEIDRWWVPVTAIPLFMLSGYMGFVGIHRMYQ